jgi:uncharacterized protein (DUF1330 family)
MRLSPQSAPIFSGLFAAIATVITLSLAAAQTEKKAYLLVQVDVTDIERYQEYGKHSPAIIAKFGGRYLARAGRTLTLEGTPAKARVVVIEFPSLARARAFYDSPEYVAARKLREGAGDAQFVVVEGIE